MADIAVLDVRLHGRSIGTLTRLPGDRNLFAFNENYIRDPERATLSLSFKDAFGELLTEFRPVQTRLPPFFANLLPEGAMRDYLAERAHVNPKREFFLAWVLGRDLPGALEIVSTTGEDLPSHMNGNKEETEEDNDSGHHGGGGGDDGVLRFALAGVQLKFSAVKEATGGLTIPVDGTGGAWIVKLPSTTYNGVPENEFAMMELARRLGIEVPETQLIPINKIKGMPKGIDAAGDVALAVKRFDRIANQGKVHMEDFAQVFGIYPENKYKKASYGSIARVLWIEIGEPGIKEFLRRLVFNALIGNADMHVKNWTLIYPDTRRPQLSPGYDFVSTIAFLPDDELALNFVDSKAFASLTVDQFARLAAKASLPEKLTLGTMRETVAAFREVWRDSSDVNLDEGARAAIEEHLKTIPIWTA
jgi:serine/threonine-protein kinase HipA